MGRAQNRADIEKWKKKRHPATRCSVAKCPVCSNNKFIGGNNKAAIKPKHYQKYPKDINTHEI